MCSMTKHIAAQLPSVNYVASALVEQELGSG